MFQDEIARRHEAFHWSQPMRANLLLAFHALIIVASIGGALAIALIVPPALIPVAVVSLVAALAAGLFAFGGKNQ